MHIAFLHTVLSFIVSVIIANPLWCAVILCLFVETIFVLLLVHIILVLFVIFIFVLKSPWSVSGAFYWIEDFFKNLFQGTAYSTLKHAPVTAYGSNIRNIGLLTGSLISILFSKRFSIKKIRFGKQVLVSEGYYK